MEAREARANAARNKDRRGIEERFQRLFNESPAVVTAGTRGL
jgi:hypothetical protein